MRRSQETTKYFSYLRKSSEDKERQALSIPAQRQKITEAFGGLDVAFLDEERSAFLPHNRPVFSEMLDRIRRGERTGLLAWHPDRLSRNEVDAAALTYMLRTGEIADLKFVTYHFENTPEGIWMLQMALSQSQYESAKKGRDVKRGLEEKARLGTFPGPAPLGYRNSKGDNRGNKKIYVDAKRFALLRRCVDLFLTGSHTVPHLWRTATVDWGLRSQAGKIVSRSNFYNVFTRPFYYGEYEYPLGSGNWYRGTHKPLMTRDEYEKIQALLGRSTNPRPKAHHDFPYRGPIHCGECGALVTAERKTKSLKGGGVATYIYYHCTGRKDPRCSQRSSVEETELDRQIAAELALLEIPASFSTWAVQAIKAQHLHEVADREKYLRERRRDYDACLRRIDNLIDMRAAGEIDQHEFRNRKQALAEEKRLLASLLEDVNARADKWLEVVEQAFGYAEAASRTFARAVVAGHANAKKEVFSALGSNHTLARKTLNIRLDPVLAPIRQAGDEVRSTFERFEPTNQQGSATSIDDAYAASPRLLGALDEVRTAAMSGCSAFRFKCAQDIIESRKVKSPKSRCPASDT